MASKRGWLLAYELEFSKNKKEQDKELTKTSKLAMKRERERCLAKLPDQILRGERPTTSVAGSFHSGRVVATARSGNHGGAKSVPSSPSKASESMNRSMEKSDGDSSIDDDFLDDFGMGGLSPPAAESDQQNTGTESGVGAQEQGQEAVRAGDESLSRASSTNRTMSVASGPMSSRPGSEVSDTSKKPIYRDLLPLRENAVKTVGRIDQVFDITTKVNMRQHGIGSKGGHIARELGAPGPINGHRKIMPKDKLVFYHGSHQPKGDPRKHVKVQLPEWNHRFKNLNTISVDPFKKPFPVVKLHNVKRDVQEYLSLSRSLSLLPPEHMDSRQPIHPPADEDELESVTGFETSKFRRTKLIDESNFHKYYNDKNNTIFNEDSVFADADQWEVEVEEMRPYPSALVRSAEKLWQRMIVDLKCAALRIEYRHMVELANCHAPASMAVDVVGYIAVLLGVKPTWSHARRYLFRECVPLLQFLHEVEPLTIPYRRLRRAIKLREERLMGHSDESIAACSQPIGVLYGWVASFNVIAMLIINVRNRRFEKMQEEALAMEGDAEASGIDMGEIAMGEDGEVIMINHDVAGGISVVVEKQEQEGVDGAEGTDTKSAAAARMSAEDIVSVLAEDNSPLLDAPTVASGPKVEFLTLDDNTTTRQGPDNGINSDDPAVIPLGQGSVLSHLTMHTDKAADAKLGLGGLDEMSCMTQGISAVPQRPATLESFYENIAEDKKLHKILAPEARRFNKKDEVTRKVIGLRRRQMAESEGSVDSFITESEFSEDGGLSARSKRGSRPNSGSHGKGSHSSEVEAAPPAGTGQESHHHHGGNGHHHHHHHHHPHHSDNPLSNALQQAISDDFGGRIGNNALTKVANAQAQQQTLEIMHDKSHAHVSEELSTETRAKSGSGSAGESKRKPVMRTDSEMQREEEEHWIQINTRVVIGTDPEHPPENWTPTAEATKTVSVDKRLPSIIGTLDSAPAASATDNGIAAAPEEEYVDDYDDDGEFEDV